MATSSKYADEGTIAHILAALCLTEGNDAAAYVGRLLESADYEHAKLSPSGAKRWMTCWGSHALSQANAPAFEPRSFSMEVTEQMAADVQIYVDMVRARVEQRQLEGAVEVTLLVEQSLPIGHITGEDGATGTGDVVIVSVWADGTAMLDLIDLKFGRGVEVQVVENEQLQMYGCGALANLDLLYDFKRACLTVHQPRVNREPSDWEIDIEVLREFEQHAAKQAKTVHLAVQFFDNWKDGPDYSYLQAGDHCRKTFCDQQATCPKLAERVIVEVGDDFENLVEASKDSIVDQIAALPDDQLGVKMQAVDMVEGWCKAVRAETERRLLAGGSVAGFKLVQGKRGARAWVNEGEAEATFKSMRLKQDEMYDFKLISPTTAEKLLKDTPKRWNRITPLISQSEGKPSVAPESDKRPALVITPVADDFEEVADDLAG